MNKNKMIFLTFLLSTLIIKEAKSELSCGEYKTGFYIFIVGLNALLMIGDCIKKCRTRPVQQPNPDSTLQPNSNPAIEHAD